MTILLTPFMSCSAKLPIYAFFSAMFFPKYAALVMIGLYMTGILVGILVALIIKSLPWGDWSIYFGIAIGIVLCLMYEVVSRFIYHRKLTEHYSEKIEKYISDVLNY